MPLLTASASPRRTPLSRSYHEGNRADKKTGNLENHQPLSAGRTEDQVRMATDDLLRRTRAYWEPRHGRKLSKEEACEIVRNVVELLAILEE